MFFWSRIISKQTIYIIFHQLFYGKVFKSYILMCFRNNVYLWVVTLDTFNKAPSVNQCLLVCQILRWLPKLDSVYKYHVTQFYFTRRKLMIWVYSTISRNILLNVYICTTLFFAWDILDTVMQSLNEIGIPILISYFHDILLNTAISINSHLTFLKNMPLKDKFSLRHIQLLGGRAFVKYRYFTCSQRSSNHFILNNP